MLSKICKSFCLNEASGIYTFVNPYSYVKIRRLSCVSVFDGVMVDGISAVLIFRMLGFNVQRNSFDMTSLAPKIFKWARDNNKKIAIIGSGESEAKLTASEIEKKYPGIAFVFVRGGYFETPEDRVSVINDIANNLNPDVLIVGMGAVKQEEFLSEVKSEGWKGLGFTCGGFIHQTASSGVNYYPRFFNKYNLRWVYRMIDEPKLIGRYLFDYPKFLFYVIFDFIGRLSK